MGRLVLLEKPKKDTNSEQTYRPICLLNKLGKLYERIINKKLHENIEREGGLADLQFGFRNGGSTVDALNRVKEIAKHENSGALRSRDFCLLITVDVRNAFNSAPWKGITKAMDKKDLHSHLIQIIKAYLSDRTLQIGESKKLEVTYRVP